MEGALKGLVDFAEEESVSLAWIGIGYFLLALPITEHDQEEDLV